MDSQALATLIAAKVTADTGLTVAVIGLIGVFIGAIIGVCGSLLLHWLQSAPQRKLDKQRSDLLFQMLNNPTYDWRSLSTLSRVIGASEATTKRLLIGISARGSEKKDGMWGLLSRHPLNEIRN